MTNFSSNVRWPCALLSCLSTSTYPVFSPSPLFLGMDLRHTFPLCVLLLFGWEVGRLYIGGPSLRVAIPLSSSAVDSSSLNNVGL